MRRLLDGPAARATGLAAASALAAVAVCALVGTQVLMHPGSAVVGRNPSSDFQIMTWSLEWWPWAVSHGIDPLHTHLLWPPGGFSTLWMTTIPVPALLALPLTLTAGPLVAYNVLMLAAVLLATAAAYLLCYELTTRVVPSILGGLVFGLSPYMLGHTLSQHLDLTFVFPLPLLVLLGLRYLRGTISGRRFVFGFAVLLLVLVGSSLELFIDLTFVGAIVGALVLVFAGSQRRPLACLGGRVALAYAACLPVLVPIGILGLTSGRGPFPFLPSDYAVDLLNLVDPTPTMLTGVFRSATAVSGHFVGNIGERDGYIGVPLLVVSLLAVRAEWRRGAWIAGLLVVVAVLFSLGPTLTVDGRPLLGLPFAMAQLPVLADALPDRMSLFAALGLSCLCALWFAQPGRRALRVGVGALVAISLFPNFWPVRSLPHAWADSTAFAWSTPQIPAGFVDDRRWPRVVKPGSTVLVLPTRDRTDSSYWQAQSGMRFALAIPETPFVPQQIAANPTVARLVDNVLPQFDGIVLGAARLRAFLHADHVGAIVAIRGVARRWLRLAQRATATRPVALSGALVFRVRAGLKPLVAAGEINVARARVRSVRAPAHRDPRPFVRAWLHFDGTRAHLRVRLANTAPHDAVTLSSPTGDAEAPSVAIDASGRAAVVFTEWRDRELLLRVATNMGSGWQIATLDRSRLPIWSQRVTVTPGGTVIAAWIDDAGARRRLRAAALPRGGHWQTVTTLDNGDGLGAIALGSGRGNLAVVAWPDSVASEGRVRATIYTNGAWQPVLTLARSLARLDTVTVARPRAASVRWRRWESGGSAFFEAPRRGVILTKPELLIKPEDLIGVRRSPKQTKARGRLRSSARRRAE